MDSAVRFSFAFGRREKATRYTSDVRRHVILAMVLPASLCSTNQSSSDCSRK